MSETPTGIVQEIRQRAETIVQRTKEGLPEVKDLIANSKGHEALSVISSWFNRQSAQEPEMAVTTNTEHQTSPTIPSLGSWKWETPQEYQPYLESKEKQLSLPTAEEYPIEVKQEIVVLQETTEQSAKAADDETEIIISNVKQMSEEGKPLKEIQQYFLNAVQEKITPLFVENNKAVDKRGANPANVLAASWFTETTVKSLARLASVRDKLYKFGEKISSNPNDEFDPFNQILWDLPRPYFPETDIKVFIELNEGLPHSREILTHKTDRWISALINGELRSRKRQLEKTKEAEFATGAIKDPKAELYPCYFYKDSIITSGIKFVFSKRGLLGNGTQIAESSDGTALYDKNFHGDNQEENPGYFIDLTQEPFLLVIDPNKGKKLVPFIKKILLESDSWKGKVADVDGWINKHVCPIENSVVNTPEGINQIKERLFNSFPIPELKPGFVVPSGASDMGNEYVRGPLYCFQQKATT